MILSLEEVSKYFVVDGVYHPALSEIDLEVNEGEFVTLIGPSGCGKSTLLRIIAGLIPPTSGKIFWQKKSKIGFVFQNYALFPYLTAYQNIEFGL